MGDLSKIFFNRGKKFGLVCLVGLGFRVYQPLLSL